MTSAETQNMKFVVDKLSFLLVTPTAYSNAWFDNYKILKSGQGAGQFLERLDTQMNDQVLRAQKA
jgi:hypothetical protein